MQLFTPSSTILLLAATSSLMTAVVSAERATTCEGNSNVHRLRCDKGVIIVQAALYGRADSKTCIQGTTANQVSTTTCSQNGTMNFVSTRCNGTKECELNMKDVGKLDPCSSTFKYLDTNYTCLPAIRVVACERSLAHLYCDVGQVISVYGAEYGRRDDTTCAYKRTRRQTRNTLCFGSTNKVAQKCNEKNRCTISAENSVFGDPCHGTYKYLEVAYVCQYPMAVPNGH